MKAHYDMNSLELIDNIYKALNRDKSNLRNQIPSVYGGQQLPPMSSLTQKSRELQNQFAQKHGAIW